MIELPTINSYLLQILFFINIRYSVHAGTRRFVLFEEDSSNSVVVCEDARHRLADQRNSKKSL